MSTSNDLATSHAEIAARIRSAHPPLSAGQALIEAERCYTCHDAPCVAACPTGIDIPAFIGRIAQGNVRGAAAAILLANPLGGMCARVCPTEVLCEGACVRHTQQHKPVEIGLLQRHATDVFFARGGAPLPLFTRAARSGRRVAVVGAGPAGLACAHGLARLGHDVVLFDGRPKPGGLNEYGIASYKTPDGFAQAEVQWLLSIGGIELRCGQALGRELTLDGLRADYDAVFLGLGLAGVNALGIPEPQAGETVALAAAVDFIVELRQASDLSRVPVGRQVVVIGGGMTAIDAAVQARILGAETATIVYRRGAEAMPASRHEQEWAQTQGVLIRHWAAPEAVLLEAGRVTGVRFARTRLDGARLAHTGESFTLACDMVLRAIGQTYVAAAAGSAIALHEGRIRTDAECRTSVAGVWAGGDCRAGGRDLTVEAVQDGKVAAGSIDAALRVGAIDAALRAGTIDAALRAGAIPTTSSAKNGA